MYVASSTVGSGRASVDSWTVISWMGSGANPLREDDAEAAVPVLAASWPELRLTGWSFRPVGGRDAFVGGRDAFVGGRDAFVGGREACGGRDAFVGGREPSLVDGQSSSISSTWPRRFERVCIFASSSSSCSAWVLPPCLRIFASVREDIAKTLGRSPDARTTGTATLM